jgi:hypothetical protein
MLIEIWSTMNSKSLSLWFYNSNKTNHFITSTFSLIHSINTHVEAYKRLVRKKTFLKCACLTTNNQQWHQAFLNTHHQVTQETIMQQHHQFNCNALPDNLSELDPTFVKDVCESLKDHWLVGLSSESYMITPLICNNNLNTKYIPRSTLIGLRCEQTDLQSVKNTDLAQILYGGLRTGL